MRPGATCEVWIDGVRAPDAPEDLHAGRPTVLDGLQLQWGRSTLLEQPNIGTCSLTIRDPRKTSTPLLDIVHTGSKIEVFAEGQMPSPGDVSVMVDSSFEAAAYAALPTARWDAVGGNPQLTVVDPGGATKAVQVKSLDGLSVPVAVLFPPLPFADPSSPAAWDSAPRMAPAQRWKFTIRVRVPAGVMAQVIAYAYTTPQRSGRRAPETLMVTHSHVTADNTWQTLTGEVIMSADADIPAWVALGVQASLPSPLLWSETSGTWDDAIGTWDDLSTIYVDDLDLLAPASTTRRVVVFSGRATDVTAQAAGQRHVELAVTAADTGADLANDLIGDAPWPAETLETRAGRIVGAARAPLPILIDPGVRTVQVARRDVDSQPVLGMLQDLAQSAGAALWTATHLTTGPYLYLEDPAVREAVRELHVVDDLVTIDSSDQVTLLSAADVQRDPVQWRQSVADVITAVEVVWLLAGTDEDGQPPLDEQRQLVTDTADAIGTYGLRTLSVSTELTSSTAATVLAAALLARARNVGWRADGFTFDTARVPTVVGSVSDADRMTTLMDLLDGTTRIGLGVTVLDLPEYAPAGAVTSTYVEGGTYTYSDGHWSLDLAVSPAAGQGNSATWSEIPTAWTWDDIDPGLTWSDIYGATVAP